MTDILGALQTGIVTKLSQNAGIISDGGRIGEEPLTDKVAYPFYSYSIGNLKDLNISPLRTIDVLLDVRCWSTDINQAQTGASNIDDALTQASLSVSGFNVFRCICVGQTPPHTELDAEQMLYARGYSFRITFDQ